jgi:uncharacterized protein DUF6325
MSAEEITEMGPIDYVLIEWGDGQLRGDAAPLLADLVDRGTIRILDLSLIAKDENGEVSALQVADVAAIEGLEELMGASSGMLDDEDLAEAATALEPGAAAALLIYENSWAAPFATAVRRNGGQLVASGRIPVQAVIAALDAVEAGS